jgi:hypothetical protein
MTHIIRAASRLEIRNLEVSARGKATIKTFPPFCFIPA